MPSPWTEIRAALDPLARQFGYYTAYRLREAEYVGTAYFPLGIHDAQDQLLSRGYEPQRLSAAKRHPGTGQLHGLSYRRVPEEHPPEADATRIQQLVPRECQYHVHAFQVGGDVEYFSHYEARPDLLRPSFDLARLRTHYRPRYGQDYLLGVTDLPF